MHMIEHNNILNKKNITMQDITPLWLSKIHIWYDWLLLIDHSLITYAYNYLIWFEL